MISKSNIAVIDAFSKGYRINESGQLISPKGVVKKLRKSPRGYLCFSYRINRTSVPLLVHRLCAYQKYGDIIFNADNVRHLDGNSLNNSPINIEIGTYSDNCQDKQKEVRVRCAKNASKHQSSYRNDDRVAEIKEYYKKTCSYKLTQAKFGISSKGTLWYILNIR